MSARITIHAGYTKQGVTKITLQVDDLTVVTSTDQLVEIEVKEEPGAQASGAVTFVGKPPVTLLAQAVLDHAAGTVPASPV